MSKRDDIFSTIEKGLHIDVGMYLTFGVEPVLKKINDPNLKKDFEYIFKCILENKLDELTKWSPSTPFDSISLNTLEPFIDLLKQKGLLLRKIVCETLGIIGRDASVEVKEKIIDILIPILQDGRSQIHKAAGTALAMVTGAKFKTNYYEYETWKNWRDGKTEDNKDKKCFIATTVLENCHFNEIDFLYQFRDQFLKKNKFGRIFISFYYKTGPIVALSIKGNEKIKILLRTLLLSCIRLMRTINIEYLFYK
jgi:hypothetical protein